MKINFTNVILHKWGKLLRTIMRTFIFLFFTSVFSITPNNSFSQNAKIKIDSDMTISVAQIFELVQQQAGYKFVYSDDLIADAPKVELKKGVIPAKRLIRKGLSPIGCSFEFTNNETIIVKKDLNPPLVESTISLEQQRTIMGNIKDENGGPLPGASIVEKGTTNGISTDFNGDFSLDITSDPAILIVSYLGFLTKEVAVGASDFVSITLLPDTESLEEVVVTALGIRREEKALGYAVQEISGESLQKVSGVDVGTSLTGKVAGLLVKNSTDFNVAPEITIRGEEPLLVIDGIAYANKTLSDVSSEDIESMSVLKGATASSLYGFRGANGAILITTKNGSTGKSGLSVDLTTNTMFSAGFLAIPEKQSIYGRGTNNTYDINTDQSWGQVMDGSIQTQWDPILKEFRDFEYLPIGKDNFKNFLEQGYITNNNVNVAYREGNVALRSSINWTENKGQYPNSTLDKYTYTLGGDIDLDKFQLTSNLSYARRESPNMGSNGYTSYDPMYTLLIWGPVDYNVLDYKDNYWIIPDVLQNNHYGYDYEENRYRGKSQNSPYFDRYEKTNEVSRDIFNADLSMSYDIADWLKATVRSGLDFYVDRGQLRVSQGSYVSTGNTAIPGNLYTWNGTRTGAYVTGKTQGFSTNSDLLLTGNKTFDKFEMEYLVGGTIYYKRDDNINAQTVGGISIPGFFSLNASVEPAAVSETTYAQQVNSAFGRFALSWNKLIYFEVTGRNDWSSTLAGPNVSDSKRSYFYPSTSSSLIISELLPESTKSWLDLLKIRNSWTQSKTPAGIYEINSVFTTTTGLWNNVNGASAPSSLYDLNSIRPQSADTYEVGLQGILFKKRLTFDVSYYTKDMYNLLKYAPVTAASGYTSNYINTDEERARRGWEVALTARPIDKEDWQWDLSMNWSTYKEVYTKLDPLYSTEKPWIKENARVDAYVGKEFLKVPETGENIYSNGRIQRSAYSTVFGYSDPDWLWGVNSTLQYKNLSLFVSMDGVVGGLMNTRTESYMWQSGGHPDSVTEERALDVATPGSENYIGDGVMVVSGDVSFDTDGNILEDTRAFAPNDVPTTYLRAVKDLHNSSAWGGSGTTADAYEKTFFKLREVSLTYNVPNRVLEGWGPIKNASISFIGQNVLLWAKDFKYSDPDGGREDFSDPSVRYLGANIKLSF
ncbi:SusC/RagA family TonB-linked outer membrane protein [Maribacter polysaccharolyticus]|uniref:SusC/RagA family TonB-linked outer membrane protein n=1 Tax=Maribacter polysaccharolyticus TaxID=3020831 RepID=UPI00237FA5BA|nr:SusC/RagA family TonB-linked outer membrane protein [Maribacter polysaccharolyticus]MDE3741163.1 SusC/RagA family TonB-linked outer membrane protein [Maribacter polysaccharolyticus]